MSPTVNHQALQLEASCYLVAYENRLLQLATANRIYQVKGKSTFKEEFVTAAKKELQPYLTKKDEKQIDTTYDTTYTIDRRH